MRGRFAFADRAESLRSELRSSWIDPIAAEGARLHQQADALARSSVPAAAKVSAVQNVTVPPFEFLEGPKAMSAAFFGLVGWLAGAVGIDIVGDELFVFDYKAFPALFASIAVDLGIVFLTRMRVAGQGGGSSRPVRGLDKPTPPRLASIFEAR